MDKLKKSIPEAAQALLSPDGYFKRFFELVETHQNYRAAYTALEEEYKQYFGCEKYTTYESFRNMKARYLKSLKKMQRMAQ